MPPLHLDVLHISTPKTMGRLWYSVFVTLASSAILRRPSPKKDVSANPIALIQYVPLSTPSLQSALPVLYMPSQGSY